MSPPPRLVALLAALALGVDGVRAETNSGSTVIYVVIAVVVLLFLAAAVFVWMRSRKRSKEPASLPMHEPAAHAPAAQQPGARPPSAVSQPSAQPREPSRDQPREQPRQPSSGGAAPNNNYRGYSSPAGRQDPRNQNNATNAQQQHAYQEPQRPARPTPPPSREPGNANANAQPRRPSHPPSGAAKPGAPAKSKERPQRANETAARVLAEFQSDPALCRRKIPYAALYFTRVLSKGAFGEVWLAQLENRQVAVKRILNEKKNDEKEIECFAAEIKLMASFYHPKIVEFVGVSWSTLQDLCAVTEYMSKGDLYGFLKRKGSQLNWRDHKIYLAEDVADALGYLHSLSPKVIHRDLKSKNILLDDSFRAKLSDFGISRERSLEETMTAGVGTIYWTAPEVLMGKKYTEKADIYSFGIVMSELDTHEVPYSDLRDEAGKKLQGMKIVQQVIKKKMRPTFSASCPTKVRELAARCLDSEPDERPDAIELLHLIQRIQQQL